METESEKPRKQAWSRFCHLPLALLLTLKFLPAAYAEGAKSLFDKQLNASTTGEKSTPKCIGLTYSVELIRQGKLAQVDSRFPFRSGDQLRFHVQSNIDGYLYILMKQGSRGDSALLYPAPGSDENNKVSAGKDLMVPANGVLEFDAKPGTEILKVVLSKDKLTNDPAQYSRSILITPKENTQSKTAACEIDFKTKIASQVDFTPVEAKPFHNEAAMTVVSREISKPLSVELQLQHGYGAQSASNQVASKSENTKVKPKETKTASSVPSSVVAHKKSGSDKWALIIGVSKFKNPRWNLMYPAKDAQDLASYLVKEGNFSSDHVKLLTNEHATRENILTELGSRWLPSNVKPGDIVLVYFATHATAAAMDAAHKNFLVAFDTDPLNAFATGIEMQDLARTIKRRLNSDRIVIVLDTCHSGSADPGAKGLEAPKGYGFEDLVQGTGQMVIASASEDQIAHDSLRYKNGIFTKHFIDGLRTKASLADAFAYTKKRVDEESLSDFKEPQTPVIKDGEWHGDNASLAGPPEEPRPVKK